MYAVGNPMRAGQPFDIAPHRHAAILQRMRLDDEVVMLRRALGETFDHQFKEIGHRVEGRMFLERGIMLQLQQRQMVGKAAQPDLQRGQQAVGGQHRHQQEPLEVEAEFLGHRQAAMRFEIAVIAVSEHHEPMVKRTVKDVVAHVAPMARRQGASMSERARAACIWGMVISISRELPFDPPRS